MQTREGLLSKLDSYRRDKVEEDLRGNFKRNRDGKWTL
jgi:hypothetical protein